MDSKNYFENETKEKSFGFKLILIMVALMTFAFTFFRVKRILTNPIQLDPTIGIEPLWYSYIIVILAITTFIGLFFTYKFRKWGVYTVIISLFLMIISNPEFHLIKTLLPMFTLFTFVGYGLFEIIPKWRFFK